MLLNDEYFMRLALNEAEKAMEEGEIPVGCVIVSNDLVIAKGHNMTETLHDVTAHAEMQAFTAASEFLDAKYLTDCTLYVTLEPCLMCLGASYWTQIHKIVYGATDLNHKLPIDKKLLLHPKTQWTGGVLEKEAMLLLHDFFKKKRNNIL
ncbi:MAG: nucleoside deaminase [Bacteroidales bacterium]|jgi:tRNA(adenine34) deaminase|nr:nucleoside deaminase [Bacteroidales bacterium]